MKTIYTITISFPKDTGRPYQRTLYFGTLKNRVAAMDECNARGFAFSTNIEHAYTGTEGLKAIDLEARYEAMYSNVSKRSAA